MFSDGLSLPRVLIYSGVKSQRSFFRQAFSHCIMQLRSITLDSYGGKPSWLHLAYSQLQRFGPGCTFATNQFGFVGYLMQYAMSQFSE
jgi:hypothetical protein